MSEPATTNYRTYTIPSALIEEVTAERRRQIAKFGEQRDHEPLYWNAILGEEKGEVDKACLDGVGLRAEIVQVAAVALAWLEKGDPE